MQDASEHAALRHERARVTPGGGGRLLAAAAATALALVFFASGLGIDRRGSVADSSMIRPAPADPEPPPSRGLDSIPAEEPARDVAAERAALRTQETSTWDRSRALKPGSERWQAERLRELATRDRSEFARETRALCEFDATSSAPFAALRVALETDESLAEELGSALLDRCRRTDRDRFAAVVLLLERFDQRSNAAAKLLDSLSAEEAPRYRNHRRDRMQGAEVE